MNHGYIKNRNFKDSELSLKEIPFIPK